MSVYTNPPEWEAQGKKPPSSKRTEGWKPGDRVPASWLNWFWFSTVNSLREIAQAFVSHTDDKNNPHGVTIEQIGAAPLDTAIPRGGIIMWSGSVDSIPPGWALCDGRNGTPDLRDRFIVGAGGSYAVGSQGGSASHDLSHDHSYSGTTGNADGPSRTSGLGGSRSSDRNHRHSYSGVTNKSLGTIDNRPPYYALCFIMKL